MGIPYYFYILTKSYNSILLNNIDFKPDLFYFDFNGIIHPIAKKYNNDEKILENLWNKVIDYKNIADNIYICIDGIAPLAKIIQQRKRRYLSTYKKILDKEENIWDTNAITPGTEFMNKLNKYLKSKIKDTKNIHLNGSDKVGEGEHKIFQYIKKLKDDKTILIHGLDADLIILSLISHKKNIYLMREKQENDKYDYSYVSINELRNAIIKDLIIKWNLDGDKYTDNYSQNSIDLVETYCVMCSLLGNDFLPHLLTLNLKNNGLESLMLYTKNAINMHGLLVENGSINHNTLTEIFISLSKTEDSDLFNIIDSYINKKVHNSNIESDYYAIKHKDNIAKEIYSNTKEWRYIYYKYKFNSNIYIDSSVINIACKKYIEGIYWTYMYYKYYIIDHNWYYPFNHPPIIKDISNHCTGNQAPDIKSNGTFINNDVQLLLVLPVQSNNLLKKKLKLYTENENKGLLHLFPRKYNIDTFLKTHLWECYPNLPKINIEHIKNILNI